MCLLVLVHMSVRPAVGALSVVSAAQEIISQKHYIFGLEDSKLKPHLIPYPLMICVM